MKLMFSSIATAALVVGTAAFAQTPSPQTKPNPAPAAAAQKPAGDQQVTVSGCVMRETDFRRAQDAGRGGVAGTGVGAGNEFVLASVSSGAGSPTGTAGTTGGNTAYELTGSNEKLAAEHVGKRVEITGTLKPAEVGAAGRPTGGPTAGAPPSGVDVTSKDLQLRELEITSVRAATTGTCAPTP